MMDREACKCGKPVRVYSTDDGAVCDECRSLRWRNQCAEERAARCAHIEEKPDPWLRDYGTPEGKERWLQHQTPYYEKTLDGRPRTPAQARASAMARYRRLLASSYRTAPFALACAKGFTARFTASCDHRISPGGALRVLQGPVTCDRQDSCREYKRRET